MLWVLLAILVGLVGFWFYTKSKAENKPFTVDSFKAEAKEEVQAVAAKVEAEAVKVLDVNKDGKVDVQDAKAAATKAKAGVKKAATKAKTAVKKAKPRLKVAK